MSAIEPKLSGRRILLGVTAGIAAYKAADLVRRLKEAGADVQVVMTASAREFIAPLTFQALSGREVRTELFDPAAEAAMGHIELARWPDLILVAPASADFLARLAAGMANDLLTTLCLATDRPIAVAPAMNRLMWSNPATVANLATLRSRGIEVLGPGAGSQACGETGEGRMLEPLDIRARISRRLAPCGALSGLHAVVTAGPTREAIDPVRFITNRSSGKMGYALAEALAGLGAEVTLISGPTQLPAPPGLRRIDVETADEMLQASEAAAAQAQIFVGAAAVADYRVASVAEHKIKKSADQLSLQLLKNPDILARLREIHPQLFMVGFAAETEQLETHARAKLERKRLDMIAANLVGNGRAFDRDDNQLSVYWTGGGQELAPQHKSQLARELAELIAQRYRARTSE